ncbi:TPA: hypothetical protein PCF64_003009 [Klebsiella quasipneumoniae]|uniref:hypothetical protein n=1 Tax=Klebsiella quasipneumoniae TaxID=1463165 RepID=UPI003306664E|nr:hypothetical protein [Klebsiella quasipneumoniae]HDE1952393.1 hypothetical protein [Klebsiella quasipneumoniae]HDG7749333.1 hypothetical protein [Klebsiella quasipneumoniae]
MNISTVNELIASLESAGELSIREQKFLKLAKAFKQLAAENVALKAAFHPSDIPSEWTDVFGDTAVIEHDAAGDNQGHSISWSWVDNQEEVIKSVLLAVDKGIETPTTDRIVAGIKADGVEEFAAYQRAITEEWACKEGHSSLLKVAESAEIFAKQLREGEDK